MKNRIEVGDIVSPGFYGPDAYGVVVDIFQIVTGKPL